MGVRRRFNVKGWLLWTAAFVSFPLAGIAAQAFQAAPEPARAMDRHDRAPGSHDRGRAQITQIRAHTGGTLTRQPSAPDGGSAGRRVGYPRGVGRLAASVAGSPHSQPT
jgi:hypothetical protein